MPNASMVQNNVRVTITYTTKGAYDSNADVGVNLLSWVEYGAVGGCARTRGPTVFQVRSACTTGHQ